MIRVCDCIMGSGKTQSAITYMNEHSEQKFIYITPYLDEAARIKESCPNLHFVEPSNKLKEYGFTKSAHTVALIEAERNIATTHRSFIGYTQETLEKINRLGYTLIIDENVDVLEKYIIHPGDIQMAVDAGYIRKENETYVLTDKEYSGFALKELFYTMKSRELIPITDSSGEKFFYWILYPRLLTSFKDVFILTYLFDGQSLHHLMQIYNIPYERIGVYRDADGTYRFGEYPGMVPEYVHILKEKIHILDKEKLNQVGDDYYALSKNWFSRNDDGVAQLKNNVYNCFRNVWADIPADQRLWGSFNDAAGKVKGKGYTNSFLTFNTKATNKYRNCRALVYLANIFMNGTEKHFYQANGVRVDQNAYALSILVQWVWRSAIRDGGDIELYIPSRRMRTILQDWIESLSNGSVNHIEWSESCELDDDGEQYDEPDGYEAAGFDSGERFVDGPCGRDGETDGSNLRICRSFGMEDPGSVSDGLERYSAGDDWVDEYGDAASSEKGGDAE